QRAQVADLGTQQVLGEPVVAHGQVEAADLRDRAQLARTQHRHGGHHDPAGLEDGEPQGDEPGVVGASQEHPVARDQTQVVDEDVRQAVGALAELPVGPLRAVRSTHARAVTAARADDVVEQDRRGVEPVGVAHLGHLEDELRPQLAGRQVVPAVGVDVRARGEFGLRHHWASRPTACLASAPGPPQYVSQLTTVKATPSRAGTDSGLRAFIVTIYGLYAREVGGWLRISTLIQLMAQLGVDGPAVRSSIARLMRRGILESERVDGRAGYALSDQARVILDEGDRRIFRRRQGTVDEGWVLV